MKGNLAQEKEDLVERLKEAKSRQETLKAKKRSLIDSEKYLTACISDMAQNLLKKTKKELAGINKGIAQEEEILAEIKIAIVKNENSFMEEQFAIMSSTFFSFVEEHLEELALNFKSTFEIKEEVKRFVPSSTSYGHNVPSGRFSIYGDQLIVTSDPYFYEYALFERYKTLETEEGFAIYDTKKTKKYLEYQECFTSGLLKTLQENFPYGDTFKFTISDCEFTLELV